MDARGVCASTIEGNETNAGNIAMAAIRKLESTAGNTRKRLSVNPDRHFSQER